MGWARTFAARRCLVLSGMCYEGLLLREKQACPERSRRKAISGVLNREITTAFQASQRQRIGIDANRALGA